jgi:hypothetical protein
VVARRANPEEAAQQQRFCTPTLVAGKSATEFEGLCSCFGQHSPSMPRTSCSLVLGFGHTIPTYKLVAVIRTSLYSVSSSDSIKTIFNMLRLTLRTNVHKLQLSNKLSKPRHRPFYTILLTPPAEDQHGLLRFSQLRPFRPSTCKLHLISMLKTLTTLQMHTPQPTITPQPMTGSRISKPVTGFRTSKREKRVSRQMWKISRQT